MSFVCVGLRLKAFILKANSTHFRFGAAVPLWILPRCECESGDLEEDNGSYKAGKEKEKNTVLPFPCAHVRAVLRLSDEPR